MNSITPGFFPGEQNRRLLFNEDGTAKARGQVILAHTSMGRFGNPAELAGAAVFLASEKASGMSLALTFGSTAGFCPKQFDSRDRIQDSGAERAEESRKQENVGTRSSWKAEKPEFLQTDMSAVTTYPNLLPI